MLKARRLLHPFLAAAVFCIDLLVWGGEAVAFNGQTLPVWVVIVPGLLGYACLGYARSPLPGYLAMLLFSFAGLLIPSVMSLAGFLLGLFFMARHAPQRQSRLAFAGAAAPIGVNTYVSATYYYDNPEPGFIFLNLALWTLLMAGVWVAGRALARSHRKLAVERRWADEAKEEAMKMERLRISRDLHDSVAHSMTAIILQVAGVRAAVKNQAARLDLDAVLGDVQSTAEQSMRELHRLLGMLRSEAGEPEQRLQGIEDIDDLVQTARASGLEIAVHHKGTQVPVDPSISHAAYRVVQEGLSNAMKHAGDGAKVKVVIDFSAADLVVSVRSVSGVLPTGAVSGGFGLMGLRERITVSGGTLSAGSTSDGYLLKAVLPLSSRGAAKFVQSTEDA